MFPFFVTSGGIDRLQAKAPCSMDVATKQWRDICEVWLLSSKSTPHCLLDKPTSSRMKLKTLKKKIRRLETRLLEGPRKLAKLKGKLSALLTANAAQASKKSKARAAGARKKQHSSAAKPQAKATGAKKVAAPRKAKRKLNLSPERREQLAAAMRARWAEKRAAGATAQDSSANHDFTIKQVPQSP